MLGRSLTQGTPWKVILRFMLPIFLGLLLQQLYNTVDAIIVGNFAGERPLAAVGACGVLTMAFLALANGFSTGAGVLVAQFYGAGEQNKMRAQASTSLILMILMGVISTVAGVFLSRFALSDILATPDSLIEPADLYFKIYAIGLIFQFGYNIVAAILRGIGDSAATLYFLLVASAINVLLDILFVYTFEWGVAGAAIATDIAQAGSFLVALIYMMKKYPVFRWKLKELTFEPRLAKQSLKTGAPMALQQFIVSVGFVFIQRAVNGYGEAMTASFTVAQRVETYMILPANALMTSQVTYTAQNIGAQKSDRVFIGAKQTVILSEIISVCVSVLVILFAEQIVQAFGLQNQSFLYCTQHIRFVAIVLCVFAGYFPILGLFQGADNAIYSTFVATMALAIRVASTYILKEIPEFGYNMIWWNTIFGWGLGFIITWVHFYKRKRKSIIEQTVL